jgi:hypothetical protein
MTLQHHSLVKPLALVLLTGAVAAPAASARIDTGVSSPQPTSATQLETSLPQTVTVVRSGGFDWGDAGIGAGAVVALAATGLGARLAVGRHRQLDSRAARPTISAT